MVAVPVRRRNLTIRSERRLRPLSAMSERFYTGCANLNAIRATNRVWRVGHHLVCTSLIRLTTYDHSIFAPDRASSPLGGAGDVWDEWGNAGFASRLLPDISPWRDSSNEFQESGRSCSQLVTLRSLCGGTGRGSMLTLPLRSICVLGANRNRWRSPRRRPEFSWRVVAAGPDLHAVSQSSYQLRIAANESGTAEGRNLAWDSGKVPGHGTSFEENSEKGPVFEPGREYVWQVRVWDERDQPSAWSRPAHWTQAPGWHARWIAADSTDEAAGSKPMPLFRKEFGVKEPVKRALLYVSGLGQYEFRINGAKAGLRELTPGWSDYRKTAFYDSYDVTAMLRGGANALGILLGNGMYRVLKDARVDTRNSPAHSARRNAWRNFMSSWRAERTSSSLPMKAGRRIPARSHSLRPTAAKTTTPGRSRTAGIGPALTMGDGIPWW